MGSAPVVTSEASRIDSERIRFGGEKKFAKALVATGIIGRRIAADLERPDSDRIRRNLLTTHIKLSANMAPEIFEYAEAAKQALGVTKPVEIYQASGNENAANWRANDTIFISLNGNLSSLLDKDSFVALFGHEFGHHLAHTQVPNIESDQEALDYAGLIAYDNRLPDQVRIIASRVSMAQEFTADRYAALATKSLEAPLRLQMALVTGLPAVRLKEDATIYLEQARSLFEDASKAETIRLGSHPEHLLRAYALGLFVDTDVFHVLTGQGTGSKRLSEVDTILEQILAGADERFYETGSEGVLPAEIQEFSLCAASLVAMADGSLDDTETKALEDTFSNGVPNWKDLLDQEKALARFGELLPVAISGGEQVAISVFNILLHVIVADREIHIRELEVFTAIGRSLQQEPLFEYFLDVAARALRVDRSEKPVDRPIPSLPPGKHETQAALNGLFSGFSRRGGGTISLRRIMRIMGKKVWESAILSVIESSISSHHLELVFPPVTDPDGNVRIDQSIIFRLTEKEQSRREEEERATRAHGLAEVKTRDALVGALKHLREKLVSGDGRSPSVRLYKIGSGRHFDLAQLDRASEGRSERVVALLNEEKTIPLLTGDEAAINKAASNLAQALRSLDREFKARVEETGCQDLFVGYPFLVGNIDGFFFRAPLVLYPFSLIGDSRGAGTFTLKRREGDTATANQALVRLLFAKKGFTFTDATADELDSKAGESPESLLSALHQLGLEAKTLSGAITAYEEMNPVAASLIQEGIMVSGNAVIGFFPQSSSDLLQDYDELLERLGPSASANLDQLLNSACDILPSAYRPEYKAKLDAEIDKPQPIVYSDPSQRQAVLRSRTARLMVMDGPPGTGKSQTIVNLIADAISRCERVAVICEKRVALDVVKQRADAAGIGHLAVVVHDVCDDRKTLYTHVADRLESGERRSFDQSTITALRAEAQQIEQQLAIREQLLANSTDVGLTVGQLHTMAASIQVAAISSPDLVKLDKDGLRLFSQNVRELHPFARFWGTDSVFRENAGEKRRRSFAGMTTIELQEVHADLKRAHESADRYEQLYSSCPASEVELEAAEPALRIGSQLKSELTNPQMTAMLGAMLVLRAYETKRIEELDASISNIENSRVAVETEKSRLQMEDTEELKTAIKNARRHLNSFFKFLLPSWKTAKSKIQETLTREWPEMSHSKISLELLAQIERRMKAASAWRSAEIIFSALHMQAFIPRDASELYKQLESIADLWSAAARLTSSRPALQKLALWPIQPNSAQPEKGWKEWSSACHAALQLLEAQNERESAATKVAESLPRAAEYDSARFARLCDDFAAESSSLSEADRILGQLEKLLPNAAHIIAQLADTTSLKSAADCVDSVRKGWAEAWLAETENRVFNLRVLDQPPPLGSAEKASERLLEIHRAIAREESLRLASNGDALGLMTIAPAAPRVRRTPAQTARETIIRECRKQRNILPMRTFVRRFAKEGLLDVVPIWLMSPETTAILFPREPIFDLLIIDEASQCTVENGFPVLTRACRAVIAGDDKQMPPTSFFKAGSSIEIDEPDAESKDVPLDVFESESLLVLARNVGINAPLRWHYRSLFEELIAFSNHSMYGGSLLTIPATLSRSAAPAIKWVHIDEGRLEDGANLPEAKRVVEVMGEILARPNCPSVGVVTFNIQQRRAILDEIDSCRSANSEFARIYDAAANAESLDARPFVKNLESVQGDERDVIIFSLGYAPTLRKKRDGSAVTYVPARFGPLGQKGGERRLNVAVSRAKAEIIVVSSFDPSMLSVAHTKHDGPRLFKAFVEFVCHMGQGRRNQAEKILDLVNDRSKRRTREFVDDQSSQDLFLPLHHQISLELERKGMSVETLVGTSEFRLPIALVRSDNQEKYALAVLCEDGSNCGQIYEKYVHIPNVLAHRQWRHIRVNAREWHRERAQIIDRICQAAKESESTL